ncbi:MAG TPA: glycoside hydrolase family 19 protein [Burkholderiaceae bacterium]|nr:glycoside hydrolase family 19 protein [Burkholderiaceae bacterium]
MTLTDLQLQQIMPTLAAGKRALYLPHLNRAIETYAVDTALRVAAFVAQLAHESGEFRWMEELWGPTDAQRRYEPPSDLAKRLGNTAAGDGQRFKGRGPIQITGRFNYGRYGEGIGVDLLADPARAAAPEVAFATAGLFWQSNGLNELADARDFVAITKRINGGTNGLADRQMYYARAQAVLGTAPAARSAPLPRGHEAIVADEAALRRRAPKKASAKKATAKKATAKKAPRAKAAPAVKKATPARRRKA